MITNWLYSVPLCAVALFTTAAFAEQDFSKVQIKTEKLSATTYMMTGEGGNLGLSIGEDAVFLLDDQLRLRRSLGQGLFGAATVGRDDVQESEEGLIDQHGIGVN